MTNPTFKQITDIAEKELKRHIGDFKNIEEIKKWYYT